MVKEKKIKKPKIVTTLKQQKAARIVAASLLEDLGNDKGKKEKLTGGEILRRAGYSKAIQLNPKMVLKSKGFLDLMQKMGFSDFELLVVHRELLESDDEKVRLSALDLGYRLRDLFPSQKHLIGKLDEIGDIITESDAEKIDKAKKVDVIEVNDKGEPQEKPSDKE